MNGSWLIFYNVRGVLLSNTMLDRETYAKINKKNRKQEKTRIFVKKLNKLNFGEIKKIKLSKNE